MTRFPFMALICVTAVGLSAAMASARDGAQSRPDFDTMDRDGNGEISQSELTEMGQERFRANDTNGDGQLDRAEMEAAAAKRTEARIERVLARLDANKDGTLSLEEMSARHDTGRMFKRLDSDGNGTVSKAEFEAGREKMRGHHNRAAD